MQVVWETGCAAVVANDKGDVIGVFRVLNLRMKNECMYFDSGVKVLMNYLWACNSEPQVVNLWCIPSLRITTGMDL